MSANSQRRRAGRSRAMKAKTEHTDGREMNASGAQ